MLLNSEGSIRPEDSDVVILTERNVIMNKPDEKETGNAGTQGSHRP